MMIGIILSFLVGILIGYNLGYRVGKNNTMKRNMKSIPLILKERSMEKGYCIICNQKKPLSK